MAAGTASWPFSSASVANRYRNMQSAEKCAEQLILEDKKAQMEYNMSKTNLGRTDLGLAFVSAPGERTFCHKGFGR